MLILGVDTSSPATSLAVLCNQEVLATYHEAHEHPPSDAVFGLLEDLLSSHGFALSDIDLFATCAGPGSFTGLRIGLSMMKTFAMALNQPVMGIDAVTIMAVRALATQPDTSGAFSVVVQGFKESTFLGRFQSVNGRPVLQGSLEVAEGADELATWCADTPQVFVDPNLKTPIVGATTITNHDSAAICLARHACRLAEIDEIPQFNEVQPLYLRAFNVGRKARKPEDLR